MNFDITTFAQSVVATILGSGIAVGLLERYWRWRDKKEDRQIQTARKNSTSCTRLCSSSLRRTWSVFNSAK